jgi:hypothetical protein
MLLPPANELAQAYNDEKQDNCYALFNLLGPNWTVLLKVDFGLFT